MVRSMKKLKVLNRDLHEGDTTELAWISERVSMTGEKSTRLTIDQYTIFSGEHAIKLGEFILENRQLLERPNVERKSEQTNSEDH